FLEQNDLTVASLNNIDTSSLTVKLAIVAVIGVAFLALFRERISQALKMVAIWIAIALALAVGYTYRFELREVADRVMAEVVPGHAATRGRVVEIARGNEGHFPVVAPVNG